MFIAQGLEYGGSVVNNEFTGNNGDQVEHQSSSLSCIESIQLHSPEMSESPFIQGRRFPADQSDGGSSYHMSKN